MNTELEMDRSLGELGQAALSLEVSDAFVTRVIARAEERRPQARRAGSPWAVAACAALVLACGVLAVPAPRAAIVGAIDSLVGDDLPGQPLTGDQIPPWVAGDRHASGVRVLAGSGDDRLVVYRTQNPGDDPSICVSYGDSVGECGDRASWQNELADEPIILRGPTGPPEGPRTLYGFLRGDVTAVRLEYSGVSATTFATPNGGFAITVRAVSLENHPTRVVAVSRSGDVIASEDVAERFWSG